MSKEEQAQYFNQMVQEISDGSRFLSTKQYIQHGDVSVYEHCLNVAYVSLWIANKFGMQAHKDELIRGALLHDYFLYDWHKQDGTHRLHGFHHASRALENANKDFELSAIEANIIARHMFPLNITPPRYKEAALVSLVDKICSIAETVAKKRFYKK